MKYLSAYMSMQLAGIIVITVILATGFAGFCAETEDLQPATTVFKNDLFVKGKWSIVYLVQDPMEKMIPSQVHLRDFDQVFEKIHRGYKVTVTCDLEPIVIACPFTFDEQKIPEKLRDMDLLAELKKTKSINLALRDVLGWLERKARYEDDPEALQTIESVLDRGSGNCVGRVELLNHMLSNLGITSRAVSGVFVNGPESRFHRWIEVDYPGVGTLPTEPGSTMDFVDPYHLVLAPAEDVDPKINNLSDIGVIIEKISEEKKFWVQDRDPGSRTSPQGLMRLKTDTRRHSGAIIGTVINPGKKPCPVELVLENKTYSSTLDEFGNFAFYGLPPGSFQIKVSPPKARPAFVQGTLLARQLIEHSIKILDL